MVTGIALQGLAECFLSPRYYEYASRQAPPGQEGMYMGYAHINTFFAWLFGFILSGYLLDAFCPDPRTLSAADQAARVQALAGLGPMPAPYAHAHYIWYAFTGVGLTAFVMLLVFQALDRRR
jgi:MFS family permease